MFIVRCLGVALAFFLLFYGAISLAVMRVWEQVRRFGSRLSAKRLAGLLFALRAVPFVSAVVITLGFVVPSFLLLEPRAVAEPIGEIPLTLGACCLLLFAAGLLNAVAAQVRTSRAVADWLQGASADSGCDPVPLFRIRPASPALTVAGVCAPRVLLSDAAAAVLSSPELETALKHEIAHVRRRDNLKKLFFRVCVFSGMAALESAWSEAAEMAADDAAVSSSREALDLASALIKLSRFAPMHAVATLTTGLVQHSGSGLDARIERLLTWDETHALQTLSLIPWYLAPTLLGSIVCVVMTYGVTLSCMHDLTEWLVR
ncbi:MAG: M56 family metallopeptidase [Terriglobales bacterium]